MKHSLFLFVFVCLFGCNALREDAEEEAREFARDAGWDVQTIVCTNQDSDDDGYVSCTFTLKDGETRGMECAAAYIFTFNSGCRDPKVRAW